jgi:hypothetical protein
MKEAKDPAQQSGAKDKNLAIKIIREVNKQAGDEKFYGDAVAIGDHAAFALGRSHRSQLTGLENIAESALKITDIFDYIKRQTARYSYWRTAFPMHGKEAFGERLRNHLEIELAKVRATTCDTYLNLGNESDEDKLQRNRVYMQLIRQFIKQMVVEYEYRVSFDAQNNRNGARG